MPIALKKCANQVALAEIRQRIHRRGPLAQKRQGPPPAPLISMVRNSCCLLGLTLLAHSILSIDSRAAECAAPTGQDQLQPLIKCSSAMCCPRDLYVQIDLVRAVAAKLKSLGYPIVEKGSLPEDSPDVSGLYQPDIESTLRSAIRQFKTDKKLNDTSGDITYDFVSVLLQVNLFERWR